MNHETVLLVVHAAATWFMTGLIWFVHVVHYPLFADVGRDAFVDYERRHVARTTWVVGPPMLVEGVTVIGLVLVMPSVLTWTGIALLVVVWVGTGRSRFRATPSLSAASTRRRIVVSSSRTSFARSHGRPAVSWPAGSSSPRCPENERSPELAVANSGLRHAPFSPKPLAVKRELSTNS